MSSENKISLLNQLDLKELFVTAIGKVSTWVLIFSNLSIIFFAVADGIGILEILWIYWIQSVIIGVFNFIKILSLKEFSTEGFTQGNKQVPETTAAKISTAFFFLFHYGFFHLVYAIFLSTGLNMLSGSNIHNSKSTYLIYAALIFLLNYIIEFIYYLRERELKPDLGKMMFAPYTRIIPMHITIIFAGFVGIGGMFFSIESGLTVIIFFTLLKTLVDVISHNTETLNTLLQKENR